MALQQVKKMPKWKQRLVFGWIHEMEKSLDLMDIPLRIIYCSLLYSKEEDYFTKSKDYDGNMSFSNQDKTITKLQDEGSIMVVGNTWVDVKNTDVAIWKIRKNFLLLLN